MFFNTRCTQTGVDVPIKSGGTVNALYIAACEDEFEQGGEK